MKLFKSFLSFLIILASVATAFEIIDFKPKSSFIEITEHDPLKLLCQTSDRWKWCTFKHEDGNICDFEWKEDVNNVTTLNCNAFAGRYRFFGDYNEYQCGVEIFNTQPSDSGRWSCEFESCYSGDTRNYSNKTSHSGFVVNVKERIGKKSHIIITTMLYRGAQKKPCQVGDEHSDPELMRFLEAKLVDVPIWGSSQYQDKTWETDLMLRVVLDKLSLRGYRVVDTTMGNSEIYVTLTKKIRKVNL